MTEHQYCYGTYRVFTFLGAVIAPFFLLALRLIWGSLIVYAGVHKFMGLQETIDFFTSLNIPYPTANAYLVAFFETVGGIALVIGFATRFFAVPLLVIMGTALATAHAAGFDTFEHVLAQPPIPFIVALLTVFCFGPGIFSVDYLKERFCCHNQCH